MESAYYRCLPTCNHKDPLAAQWRIRRRSFAAFMAWTRVNLQAGAKVIDVGAGVGWVCNHLDGAGFGPCAVDINDDDKDGLKAARHYTPKWPIVQAEFDRLPIPAETVDAVLFNASLHYSADYLITLREALRVLKPRGKIVVMDSPVYSDRSSGETMLEEQRRTFQAQLADRSDSLQQVGFLTWSMLARLAEELNISWRWQTPWYGWRWAIRPAMARIGGSREPGRFHLLWAEKQANAIR